jgi:hypothetical protein
MWYVKKIHLYYARLCKLLGLKRLCNYFSTFGMVVHATNLVPGGLHATPNRISTSHLSALAMEEIGTCVVELRCNWVLHHNLLGLRREKYRNPHVINSYKKIKSFIIY